MNSRQISTTGAPLMRAGFGATKNPTDHLTEIAGSWDHCVHFYEKDDSLVDCVAAFIGAGLGAGESAIVFATPAHRDALAQKLADQGIDLSRAKRSERYIALDAAETLARFIVDG